MSGAEPTHVNGATWNPNGHLNLAGAALEYRDGLDAYLNGLAQSDGAVSYSFPTLIAASELERIDYFRSFPHLATFAVSLDDDATNLDRFVGGTPVTDGAVQLAELAPVRAVLTPAACYHVYSHLDGKNLDQKLLVTTGATCFRREDHYVALERQWGFSMREIVCVGTADEARRFVSWATERADQLRTSLGLETQWQVATDPFFRPSANPQYLMQKIDPTKSELVFADRLALASVNFHHDHFGRAFVINRDGEPVTTACLAFGLERWLSALGHSHGPDPEQWPRPW